MQFCSVITVIREVLGGILVSLN